jgi:hypothetical protein
MLKTETFLFFFPIRCRFNVAIKCATITPGILRSFKDRGQASTWFFSLIIAELKVVCFVV